MPLSKLSSLSLACRSSVCRRQPSTTAIFSVVKYASSFHPQPPPTASVPPRHMHSSSQHLRFETEGSWEVYDEQRKALSRAQKSTAAQSNIALAMTKRLLQDQYKNSNVVYSPLSIHVLLSLIAAGSSGPTLDQFLWFLKSKSIDKVNHSASQIASLILADGSHRGGPHLSCANGVWIDQSLSLNPSFQHIAQTAYKATLRQLDFQITKADEVVSEVNTWVKNHTNGLITDILSREDVDPFISLILANALYFKGAWQNEFDPSETEEHKFYLLDGSSVEVPFMTSQERQFVAAYDGFKVLEMPYQKGHDGRHFSMYIFLPNAKDGLPSLIERLDSEPGFIDRHIPQQRLEVGQFKVPKFKFSFRFEAPNVLKKMGLVLPFELGGLLERTDSEMDSDMFVSRIIHKSFIEVDEKGTDAAAASLGLCETCSMMSSLDRIDFVADHPFFFVIREYVTRTLPFVGQVLNPIQNKVE